MNELERLEVHRAFVAACERRAWARARAALVPWWFPWRRYQLRRRIDEAGVEADRHAERLQRMDRVAELRAEKA